MYLFTLPSVPTLGLLYETEVSLDEDGSPDVDPLPIRGRFGW